MRRSEIRSQIVSCRECELADDCEGPVPFTGPTPTRIAIVGEAPGRQEDLHGKPFLGPAGKLLWETLGRYAVERQDVFVCNAVSCFPHGTPDWSYIEACRKNLLDHLRLSGAIHVLVLGSTAWKSLSWNRPDEESSSTISQVRGKCFLFAPPDELAAAVFPTWHPAAILRDPLKRKAWRADLRRFCKAASE